MYTYIYVYVGKQNTNLEACLLPKVAATLRTKLWKREETASSIIMKTRGFARRASVLSWFTFLTPATAAAAWRWEQGLAELWQVTGLSSRTRSVPLRRRWGCDFLQFGHMTHTSCLPNVKGSIWLWKTANLPRKWKNFRFLLLLVTKLPGKFWKLSPVWCHKGHRCLSQVTDLSRCGLGPRIRTCFEPI